MKKNPKIALTLFIFLFASVLLQNNIQAKNHGKSNNDRNDQTNTNNLTGSTVDPNNKKKVVICHIPPGNPDNIQHISISKNALHTHITHHGDYDGFCTDLDSPSLTESITLSGTLRDFHAKGDANGHPDFQSAITGLVKGMVKENLGNNKKPVFNIANTSTTTEENFNQWFIDTPDINQSIPYSIPLEKNDNGNYEYDSANDPVGNNHNPHGFFPLDDKLFGNEGRVHNYHMTYELHHQFTYQGGETFQFSGDDDVWIFINNKLVVDIGGVHGVSHDSINLDNLNLTREETYNFDMFWAERHTVASNFKIETSIKLEDVIPPPPNEDTQCTALFEDDFESGLSDKWRTLKASGGFTPQVVNGRLRLTNREHNLSTAVTLDYVFPSEDNKFTIEFDYYAYGGCANGSNHRGSNNAGDWGADGISIALFDSSVGASPRVGGNGGSLGYANKTNQPGFEKGWLGVGIDEYGNFENNDEGRRDLNGRTYNYISEQPNTIAIRGNETSGYRLLASTTVLGEALAQLTNESYKSGRYRFTADMFSNGFQEITLERNTGSSYTTLIGPFNGLDSTYHQGDAPEKFRIALSSGTGGACNIHEIDNLKICSEGEEYNPNTITSCEAGFFQHLQKSGRDSEGNHYKHEFGKLNIEAQTYDQVFSFDSAELNAFGYSVTDNVFYGTSTKQGDYALYELNLSGELKRLISLPTAIYAGDVDDNNVWYGFKGRDVYTVDLTKNSLSYNKKTISSSSQAVDFAFKKSDGKFYGAKGHGSNTNRTHKLYIYDPSDHSISSKILTGDIETSDNGGTYGASWTDVNGSIYIGNNKTGKIHWVDLDTWNTTEVATGTIGLSKNDGASCAEAPPPFTFDYGDAPESYGLSPHLIPTDNTPTVYLGTTVPDAEVIEATYPYTTGEATGDNDTDTNDEDGVADFQNKTLIADQIYSIDITTHGAGGYLHAWVDWNGNGTFENDTIEHVAATNVINNASGTTSLNIIVPPSAVSGVTYARFRYSTTENLSPTALANDGEVEDYKIIIAEGIEVCSINETPSSIYSTAAVAINLKRLDSSTRVFQTQFNNATWEGYLLSYDLDLTNNNGNTKSQKWNAADDIQYTDRQIFSYNPEATTSNKGIALWWDNLNTSQKNAFKQGTLGSNDNKKAIGQKRMQWIRGQKDHEKTPSNPAGILRPRDILLGDIIHSSPIFSGQRENFGYTSLTAGQGGSKYPAFLTAKQSRQAAIFVGANDGMLHAFNANTGEELFGFIPNEVIPNLSSLTSLKYGCKDAEDCIPHQYYVDGTSVVGDAYLNETWHTVLIGTLGKGGKGIFALDVTNPDPNTNPDVSLATFDQDKILWETSATQAADNASVYEENMGYSTAKPSIVRLNNGKWAAIISNGPKSALGTAMLFIIDISNGELIKAINTVGSVNSPNGLSSPIAVDINNDRTADLVYAGDLQGNMWKFDLSHTDSSNWGVAYADGDAPKPLFTTCESADETPCTKTQVITAKPEVGRHPTSGYMIYFGTGQYFDVSDNVMSASPDAHTLYGIHDNDAPITNFNDLVAHSILQESIIPDTNNDLKARITSDDAVDLTTKKGWYIPLIAPNNTKEGERIIAKALLREKRLIITTLIPPRNDCALGGGSWITELNAIDGNPLDFPPIDINDDLQFNNEDKVDYQGNSTVVSAIQKISLGMILSSPEIINHTSLSEGKYINGTSGKIGMFRESTSRAIGRQSWRRLR